jgi:hypothetical protein
MSCDGYRTRGGRSRKMVLRCTACPLGPRMRLGAESGCSLFIELPLFKRAYAQEGRRAGP